MDAKNVEVYWLPQCSTCIKAVSFLEAAGADIAKLRDIKSDKLSMREIVVLSEKVGGTEKLFSKRAIKYRAMKLYEKELSEDEMVKLMKDEYTFIRRPVVVAGDKAVAGFSARKYEELLGE